MRLKGYCVRSPLFDTVFAGRKPKKAYMLTNSLIIIELGTRKTYTLFDTCTPPSFQVYLLGQASFLTFMNTQLFACKLVHIVIVFEIALFLKKR